ncbi:hypothetical protein ISCGN_024385 [Ixodes scapularis]
MLLQGLLLFSIYVGPVVGRRADASCHEPCTEGKSRQCFGNCNQCRKSATYEDARFRWDVPGSHFHIPDDPDFLETCPTHEAAASPPKRRERREKDRRGGGQKAAAAASSPCYGHVTSETPCLRRPAD